VGANKERARREQARHDKRAAQRKLASAASVAPVAPVAPAPSAASILRAAGPTFGDVVAREALLSKSSATVRAVIARAEVDIVASARRFLKVISCHSCNEPKGCCTLTTIAYLHEAVPIVARLRAEGRDTLELRERLRASARTMETQAMSVSRNRCVFLDANDLCTIYEDRPSVCGTTFVSSPPRDCSTQGVQTESYDNPSSEVSIEAERSFETEAGLTRLKGPYLGALPRMVLLALEAWDRTDYVTFLAERTTLALRSLRAATRGPAAPR